jgi:hypothetical protein
MHDFNEDKQQKINFFRKKSIFLDLGVCRIIRLALVKEVSTKRILSYNQIEDRLMSLKYGPNDKSNKTQVLPKTYLLQEHIVSTPFSNMCLFKLFPIIFHDIFDQLATKEIYICLREIMYLL